MSKKCPLGGYALYIDCLECEDKTCRKEAKKMSVSYVHPKDGYEFLPSRTAEGRILCKYSGKLASAYKKAVPKAWVDKGYVVEVKIDES